MVQPIDKKQNYSSEKNFLLLKITEKVSMLKSEMGVIGEWLQYSAIMEKNHPGVAEWLNHYEILNKKICWLPLPDFRLGQKIIKLHESNMIKFLKSPISESDYWDKYLRLFPSEILRNVVQEPPIDYIFRMHLLYASVLFHWSRVILSFDEDTAIKALRLSSEYFDTCFGMVLFKQFEDRKNALSETRRKSGQTGGHSRAQLSYLIQENLLVLITEKKPRGGWKTKKAAVDELLPTLFEFVESLNMLDVDSNLGDSRKYVPFIDKPEALRDSIYKDWSINNTAIKAAFDKSVKRKNKKVSK